MIEILNVLKYIGIWVDFVYKWDKPVDSTLI